MSRGSVRDPVRDLIEKRISEGRMPGAAWVVSDSGGVLSSGHAGHAAIEPSMRLMTSATPFDLASLTKPLATGILLSLFEHEGQIDLGERIGDHLAPLRGSRWSETDLISLAAHLSGLPAWDPLYVAGDSLEAYLGRIAVLEPAAREGETLYSDLGYILLGAVLERVAGRSLDELFEERIARPLGLRTTGFCRSPSTARSAAATERGNLFERELAGPAGVGHRFRTGMICGVVHDANAWGLQGVAGHAGLFGTVDEVARIGRALLDPSGPFDRPAVDRLFRPVGSSRRTLGWVTAAGSDAARGVLPDEAPGHTGFTGTSIWLEPLRGRVYVLLTHRVHPTVPTEDFQPLRAEFHRLARSLPGSSPK